MNKNSNQTPIARAKNTAKKLRAENKRLTKLLAKVSLDNTMPEHQVSSLRHKKCRIFALDQWYDSIQLSSDDLERMSYVLEALCDHIQELNKREPKDV